MNKSDLLSSYPSISVVIPSFNQGQYLEQTLLSVLGQGYPDLEVIVIDGGSTDESVEILERYSDKLTYWHSKKDKGQSDAINQGMKLASGEVLCWLNSDDMYMPGTLIDVGKYFQGQTNENRLMYGSTIVIREEEENWISYGQTSLNFDPSQLTYMNIISQPSSFWTRKLWNCVGEVRLDYHYTMDWEWFIRASQQAEVERIPKFYSIYRQHRLHKSSNGGFRRRQEAIEIVSKYASSYWRDLYVEVEKHNPQISKFINDWRIPKRTWLLPILFPRISAKMSKIQDLYTALSLLSD